MFKIVEFLKYSLGVANAIVIWAIYLLVDKEKIKKLDTASIVQV